MSDPLSNNDVDPIETQDWRKSIESVIREEGAERAQYLIDQVLSAAQKMGAPLSQISLQKNYINSISTEEEPPYPGDLKLERRIRAAIRWNAIMMVLKASKKI